MFESEGLPLKPAELVKSAGPEWRARCARVSNALCRKHYALDWPDKFDYVLWIDFGERQGLLPEKLKLLASGTFFQVYEIVR